MKGHSGQAAMEYMLIVGLVMLITVPTVFLFYKSASDSSKQIDFAQVEKFGRNVISTVETVYYLGYPSRIVIEERLPNNVESISIDQDPTTGTYLLAIAIGTKAGVTNLTFPTQVNMLAAFGENDITPGIKNVRIEAKSGIGGQLFTAISFDGPLSRVFVTSITYDGNLGGITGANEICQQHADSSSLSGIWKAWLSNSTDNARDLIPDGTYIRVDDARIANNIDDLTDETIANPIQIDETGSDVGAVSVWTGTGSDGILDNDCNEWEATTGNGMIGDSSATNGEWTESTAPPSASCGTTHAIYCFEQ